MENTTRLTGRNKTDWKKFYEHYPSLKGKIVGNNWVHIGDISLHLIDKKEPGHDELCEGTMCWCESRRRKNE